MPPVDFEVWLNHFEYHAQHSRRVLHGMSGRLTPDERRLISGSIATFQLGEQSDGGTLLQATKQFGIARPARMQTLMGVSHRAFFTVTAYVVWLTHRSMLRRTGYTTLSFLSVCLSQYAFYLEPMPAAGRSAPVRSLL
jgi:hypothetical protein